MDEHDERDALARRFEADRSRLAAVAHRMLGSEAEAEDAVQEAWLRLNRSDTSDVDNLGGWLTTVLARVCLDMLRSRRARREESLDARVSEPDFTGADGVGGANGGTRDAAPEEQAMLADAVGPALLLVLQTLGPAERLAFVLHDMFGVSFEEIGIILERSPASARQLASRSRRRVRGAGSDAGADSDADPVRQHEVVTAFLAASRAGDFQALLEVLDPDVVLRADRVAVELGVDPELRGRSAVASLFHGKARGARLALMDSIIGAVWAPGGTPRVMFNFTVADGRIHAIDLVAEPARIGATDLAMLED